MLYCIIAVSVLFGAVLGFLLRRKPEKPIAVMTLDLTGEDETSFRFVVPLEDVVDKKTAMIKIKVVT